MLAATQEEFSQVSRSFEKVHSSQIVEWAHSFGGDNMVVTTSFSDAVLIDVVTKVVPDARFYFIDTGFAFPETISYIDRVKRLYSLDLTVLNSGIPENISPCGSDGCCQRRKVEPLSAALAGESVWLTGIRRDETDVRSEIDIVSFDEKYQIVKVNPLANWTHEQAVSYVEENDLPVHPLTFEGYLSIGCAPATSPVLDPGDPRSGRWPGSDKTECGLHF